MGIRAFGFSGVAPLDAGDLGFRGTAAVAAAEEGDELTWGHAGKAFRGDVVSGDGVQALTPDTGDLDVGDPVERLAASAAHHLLAQGELVTDSQHPPSGAAA